MNTRVTFLPCLLLVFLSAGFSPLSAMAALSLESSFTVTETYTDNLFFRADNKKDDFGTLFGPNLLLQYQNPDVVLGAAYLGRMGVFVKNPDANQMLHSVNAILDLPYLNTLHKGLTVNMDLTMHATPQLDAFSGSEAQNASTAQVFRTPGGSGIRPPKEGPPSIWTGGTQGIFTNRTNSFNNLAGVTVGYAWTPRMSSSLEYQNRLRRFSSSRFQNSLAHIGTFSLPFMIREGTSLIPSFSYFQTDFTGTSIQPTVADRIISQSTQLGISHTVSPTVSAFVHGGMAWTKQQGAEEFVSGSGGTIEQRSIPGQWQRNFVGSAGITKSLRNGSLSLRAAQRIGSGGGLAAQATRTRTITGSLLYTFTRRLDAFGSIGFAQNKSIRGNAFDVTTYRIQSGVTYAFFSWLSGNVSYSHIEQRSEGFAATDVTVNQVFLGVTAFADPWLLIQ